jgi:hypothetical protein
MSFGNIDPNNPEFRAWCVGLYESLNEGGVWAVPRSGLIFEKRSGQLELVNRMPWTPELAEAANAGEDVPPTAEALLAYQDQDFTAIREHFAAVKINVTDRTMKITPPGDAPNE